MTNNRLFRQEKIDEIPVKIKPKRVIFEVSGLRYETYEKTLSNFPDTLLGDVIRRNEYMDPS